MGIWVMNDKLRAELLGSNRKAKLEQSSKSLDIARNIYFATVRLLITISAALIPLVGLLVTFAGIEKVKGSILWAIIFLFLSIVFGITTLIRHALFFKNEANEAIAKVAEATKAMDEGPESSQVALIKQMWEDWDRLKTGKLYEDLEYRWSTCQLVSFGISIILLVCSLFIMF